MDRLSPDFVLLPFDDQCFDVFPVGIAAEAVHQYLARLGFPCRVFEDRQYSFEANGQIKFCQWLRVAGECVAIHQAMRELTGKT